MGRILRTLGLGVLLAVVIGVVWLRRQFLKEVAELGAAPPAPSDVGEQSDERIVLPTWTGEAPAPSSSVGGRIVLPDDVAAEEGITVEPTTVETDTNGAGEPHANTFAVETPSANGEERVVEGYCVRCKEQRRMVNVQYLTTANKRPAVKGECEVCGAGMFKYSK